jgi:hypothetical protein
MKQDNTFSSLVVFWESELESNIKNIQELKSMPAYYDYISFDILDCVSRLKIILEQIDFFRHPNFEEHDFSTIDSIIEAHKDFLKENNII